MTEYSQGYTGKRAHHYHEGNTTMSMSWAQYDQMQEAAALGDFVVKVEAVLRLRSGSRNQRCFPVCSFSGKDADLDPEGCIGIRKITGLSEDDITVEVGGHKTVCPPNRQDMADVACELVCGCGYEGEWTGEDWTLHFTEEVTVNYVWSDERSDEENFQDIADRVVIKAGQTCEPFKREMADLHLTIASLDDPNAGMFS